MIKVLRAVVIISGILVIVIPIAISLLWTQYLQQHNETIESTNTVDKCTPYDFYIKSEADEKVSVTWRTTDNCTGYVMIAPDQESFSSLSQKIIPFQGSNSTNYFVVQVPRADTIKNEYMIIVSNGVMYGIDENAIKFAENSN